MLLDLITAACVKISNVKTFRVYEWNQRDNIADFVYAVSISSALNRPCKLLQCDVWHVAFVVPAHVVSKKINN